MAKKSEKNFETYFRVSLKKYLNYCFNISNSLIENAFSPLKANQILTICLFTVIVQVKKEQDRRDDKKGIRQLVNILMSQL